MTINDSQGIDGYQDYYPFGKINLSDSRRMPGRSYTSGNLYDNYKFTGHACPDFFGERDDEFDLTLDYTCPPTGAMQARMYDPVIGRFLSVDPALEYASPYTYAGNNPLRYIDPTGMYSRDPMAGLESMRSQTSLQHGGSSLEEVRREFQYDEQRRQNRKSSDGSDENRSCLVGLNCGDAAAGLLATVELSSSQNAATSSAQRSVGYAAIGLARKASVGFGAIIGIYSLTNDFNNPNVSSTRFAYRAAGYGATLGTPFLLAKYGSIVGPKGTLIGAGVGFASVGGEYLYDNRHIPVQTYQRETSRFKRFYNRLEHSLKHWANPYRR